MKKEIKVKSTYIPDGWSPKPTDKQFNKWALNIHKQLKK